MRKKRTTWRLSQQQLSERYRERHPEGTPTERPKEGRHVTQATVAIFHDRGWTYNAIARRLKVPAAKVCRLLRQSGREPLELEPRAKRRELIRFPEHMVDREPILSEVPRKKGRRYKQRPSPLPPPDAINKLVYSNGKWSLVPC